MTINFSIVINANAIQLVGSVKKLNTLNQRQSDVPIDTKLMKALKIIDGMDEEKKWDGLYGLIRKDEFKYSKYYDELLYLYVTHLVNGENLGELQSSWKLMSNIQNSEHLYPIMLARLHAYKKRNHISSLKEELKRINDYIDTIPVETMIHGPYIEGNLLFGYKIREDYSNGEVPAFYSVKEYKQNGKVLKGFSDSNQYLGVLNDTLGQFGFNLDKLVIRAELYEKAMMKEKAGDDYYRLALHMKNNENNLTMAKKYIDLALKNNPAKDEISSLKKEIELSLVLSGEEVTPEVSQTPQKTAKIISKAECSDPFLISHTAKIDKSSLKGKSKKELRLMRNEIFAKYGRPFRSEDLHEYFTKKCWYKINPEYTDSILNAIDRHNMLTIQEAEGRR